MEIRKHASSLIVFACLTLIVPTVFSQSETDYKVSRVKISTFVEKQCLEIGDKMEISVRIKNTSDSYVYLYHETKMIVGLKVFLTDSLGKLVDGKNPIRYPPPYLKIDHTDFIKIEAGEFHTHDLVYDLAANEVRLQGRYKFGVIYRSPVFESDVPYKFDTNRVIKFGEKILQPNLIEIDIQKNCSSANL